MGLEESSVIGTQTHPFADEMSFPISHRDGSSDSIKKSCELIRREYHAVWTVRFSESPQYPVSRYGHCWVCDKINDCGYIGYGSDVDNNPLSDFWKLDFNTLEWTQINTIPNDNLPRGGARACLINNKLWIFGGFHSPRYFADLHVLDLATGQITRPETTGPQPQPRSGHVMAVAKTNKLIIWGGYNGSSIPGIDILDFSTMEWTHDDSELRARIGTSYTIKDSSLYIHGGSKTVGLLELDLYKISIKPLPCSGTQPLPTLVNACLVNVGSFLMLVGGRSEKRYTLIHVFDTDIHFWFILPIIPDWKTVTAEDGAIANDGLLMVPSIHSATSAYRPKRREIIIFEGSPTKTPSPVTLISMGIALGVLNHHKDMLSML